MILTSEEKASILADVRASLDKYSQYHRQEFIDAVADDSIVEEAQRTVLNRAMAGLRRLQQSHEPQRSSHLPER